LLSIKGILGLISDSSEISDKNRRFLELANASAERLDGTIQEILDYSRNARLELKLTEFDLEAEVRQVIDDLRFSCPENMHFEVTVNGTSSIRSDKYRVQTLLKNVISNAVKYYRTEANPPMVKVTIDTTGPDIDLRIEDNGRGIDSKNQQRVFEMFYRATSDVPGTGLGLYICKEIISKLLGSIRLESQPSAGTTVHIRLPHHP
jgi:signal transduction histidine kinase